MNLPNSACLMMTCVAVITSAACSSPSGPLPAEITIPIGSNLDTLRSYLLDESASLETLFDIPMSVRADQLREATPVAKKSLGIVAGKVVNDFCIVLYLPVRASTPGHVGVVIGTLVDGIATEYIQDNLSGAQAAQYPASHPPCE